MEGTSLATIGQDRYKTKITSRNHEVLADEPLDKDGTDLGMAPHEYLAASLASCTTITLRMYADRKEWQVESIVVEVHLTVQEQEEGDPIYHFDKKIKLNGNLDEKQRKRMMQISEKCPVHKILSGQITIASAEV